MGQDTITDHLHDANYIVHHLSTRPQNSLNWFDEAIAFFSTPVKRLGIFGWTKTGCSAGGIGVPVRDAQHSTDGFWTIDVKVITLAVSDGRQTAKMLVPNRDFLRLEVEPGTRAHSFCSHNQVTTANTIAFQGVVLIDRDGPFYEVHPSELWLYKP